MAFWFIHPKQEGCLSVSTPSMGCQCWRCPVTELRLEMKGIHIERAPSPPTSARAHLPPHSWWGRGEDFCLGRVFGEACPATQRATDAHWADEEPYVQSFSDVPEDTQVEEPSTLDSMFSDTLRKSYRSTKGRVRRGW